MKKLIGCTLGVGLWAAAAFAQDVGSLLQEADRYRIGSEYLEVLTEVLLYKADGSLDKARRYKVFVQPERRSLVLMQSPAERGQKVLMLGDDFWLLMPDSQRPLRITPMQKLLGDASTGDIANLRWAQDYQGELVGAAMCQPPLAASAGESSATGAAPASASHPCLHLRLNATRKGVTYQRIELWLGRQRHEPLRADLYVLSDKLAKQAQFVFDQSGTPTQVTEMRLSDQLAGQKITLVRYLARTVRQVPEQWLNPMFLARNPPLE